MRKLFVGALLLIASLALVSCGGKNGIPTPTPTATAANGEFTIPSNFTTYSDEDGLFNISYPQDWEVNQEIIPRAKVLIEEILMNSTSSDTSVENALKNTSILFLAGLPIKAGYDAIVCITGGPMAPGTENRSLEAVVNSEMATIQMISDSYNEISRDFTVIDGLEAVIIEFKVKPKNSSEQHGILMFTISGKIVWCTGCTTYSDANFNKYKDDFQITVRSLEVNL